VSPRRSPDPSGERGEIRAALLGLVNDDGYSAVTLAGLLDRAAVDRSTFDRHFASLDDCFTATWEATDAELWDRMASAFAAAEPWRTGMRAALTAALVYLAEDAATARLYVAEVFFAGEAVRERRRATMERFAAMIDLGRGESPGASSMPAMVADGVAGGVWHCVYQLVAAGRSSELPAELPKLMYLVVLPYLGVRAAEEELGIPSA
jgi:AcrR family transcriptional regulator